MFFRMFNTTNYCGDLYLYVFSIYFSTILNVTLGCVNTKENYIF